jgi:flagellar basal body-associated protein FliL
MWIMIAVGIALFVVALAIVWFFLARGSEVTTITEREFDESYDEPVDGDRNAAWRDFNAWQVRNEKERLSWEEPAEE